jgi:hypothetical protein
MTKCESLQEHKRLAYLEMKVDGDVWMYVDHMKFENHLDLIEALDPYYSRSTFEKQSEAQAKLTDGSLKMGPTKKFADWRGRFMAVHELVKMPDAAMIGYARKYLQPNLAAGASHGFDDESPGALLRSLDVVRTWDMTQKQINSSSSSASKPRTRDERSQKLRERSERPDRREWQNEAMRKVRACCRCGGTTHQARDRTGCAIILWADVKKKLPGMVRVSPMEVEYQAHVEDDDGQEEGQEETELDDMGEPIDPDFP